MSALLYDTHAHLDDTRLYEDLDGVLERAAAAGVVYINTVGCDWRSSLMSVHIAERHPEHIRAVVGIHPSDAATADEAMLERLTALAASPQVVAWGEIGLDYHYDDGEPAPVQQWAFAAQIQAAKALSLPIVVHDRDSHQDVLDILKREQAGQNGGVLHCFSGSWEMAKECLSLGFHISFAGPLTYHNARVPVEVASKVPLDRLLVETDSPYLSPEPFRGKTNEPARVSYTASRLAEIRGMSYEAILEQTTANALALFRCK